jgi:hypothetical protein
MQSTPNFAEFGGLKMQMETTAMAIAMVTPCFNTSVAILNVADSFHRHGNAEPAENSRARSATK